MTETTIYDPIIVGTFVFILILVIVALMGEMDK
jgi:hypothetical protein